MLAHAPPFAPCAYIVPVILDVAVCRLPLTANVCPGVMEFASVAAPQLGIEVLTGGGLATGPSAVTNWLAHKPNQYRVTPALGVLVPSSDHPVGMPDGFVKAFVDGKSMVMRSK